MSQASYLSPFDRPLLFLHSPESSTPNKQVFSFGLVEEKRYHRTLVAVINGVNVAQAILEGLVIEPEEAEDEEAEAEAEGDSGANDEDALFVRQTNDREAKPNQDNPFLKFNPRASPFAPRTSTSQAISSPSTSPALSISNGWGSQTATAPSFLSANSSDSQRIGIFGNSASLHNPSGPQPTTSQLNPSLFTSSQDTTPTSSSSFGIPSFPANAPSPSGPSIAPSPSNAWPPVVVNGIVNTSELYILYSAILLFARGPQFRCSLSTRFWPHPYHSIYCFCIAQWITTSTCSKTFPNPSKFFSQCHLPFPLRGSHLS